MTKILIGRAFYLGGRMKKAQRLGNDKNGEMIELRAIEKWRYIYRGFFQRVMKIMIVISLSLHNILINSLH